MRISIKTHLAVLLAGILLFCSCRKAGEVERQDVNQKLSDYQEYVSSITCNLVKRDEPIRIVFTEDVGDTSLINRRPSRNLLSFDPEIKGECLWESPNTLVFFPENPLEWNTFYLASLHLASLFDLPRLEAQMDFSFFTAPKSLQFEGGLLTYLSDSCSYSGNLSCPDLIDAKEIEACVSVQYNRKEQKLEWNHDGLQHTFSVQNLARDENNTTLSIIIQPKKKGLDGNRSEYKETIIGTKVFALADWNVSGGTSTSIRLAFSNPIDQEQNFNGLIQLFEKKAGMETGTEIPLKYSISSHSSMVLYPNQSLTGTYILKLDKSIRNREGVELGTDRLISIRFDDIRPEVQIPGSGVIIPQSGPVYLPFKAIGLDAVDVRIRKLHRSNILYFLTWNEMNETFTTQLSSLTKCFKIDLTQLQEESKLNQWNTYKLDLAKVIQMEPGVIYNVSIGFRKSYRHIDGTTESLPHAEGEDESPDGSRYILPIEEEMNHEHYNYSNTFYNYLSNWEHSEDPAYGAYYAPYRFAVRQVLCSDLGLMAKINNGKDLLVFVNRLTDASPVVGARIRVYDEALQEIVTGVTDSEGCLALDCSRSPFILVAEKERQVGYLKLSSHSQLDYNNFDVGGKHSEKGIKGFLYAERGVWRPGDSIYVHFILEDKEQVLPMGYPLVMDVYNSNGQFVRKIVQKKSRRSIYQYAFATEENDPTGVWSVQIQAGDSHFSKSLPIETVKPNRLKIEVSFKDSLLCSGKSNPGRVSARWLTGMTASKLPVRITAVSKAVKPVFPEYARYDFSSPEMKPGSAEEIVVLDGRTDSSGQASFQYKFTPHNEVPGMLLTEFTTRVTEGSGGYSVHYDSKLFSPFRHYAGIHVNYDYAEWKQLDCDKDHTINILTVDEYGKPAAMKDIQVKLYDLEYRWWYQGDLSGLASYVGKSYQKPVFEQTVHSAGDGKAECKLPADKGREGNYLLSVTLPDGHRAGQILYFDWSWGERPQGDAQVLAVRSSKSTYQVGEEVSIDFTTQPQAKAIITLENSHGILKRSQVISASTQGRYRFKATADMAPNVYVSIHLIQPHSQTANDLPIRMYGTLPIFVENKASHLQPVLNVPEEVRSGQEFKIKVKEANRNAMDYSLAIVDEGLLDLTNFRTPDPWSSFYAREALLTNTYDLYNDVVGSFGSRLESMYTVGGSDVAIDYSKKRNERFSPIVKVLGPFHLMPGKEDVHSLRLPTYLGSVRVMVTAAEEGRYGSAEKTMMVREPLMVQSVLPRTISPDERFELPVSVFVNDDHLGDVHLHLETEGPVTLLHSGDTILPVQGKGEYDLSFQLRSGGQPGSVRLRIHAESGQEKAESETRLQLACKNPTHYETQFRTLKAGESWTAVYHPLGMEGTNLLKVAVSALPPMNLQQRLGFLRDYPHSCAEQLISAAFPQLYLKDILPQSSEELAQSQSEVQRCIDRLNHYLAGDRGMAFWPGSAHGDPWLTAYAGHFLTEAEKSGYFLPSSLKNNILHSIQTNAKSYIPSSKYEDFVQAYRLFVLALNNDFQTAAMNRLRGNELLPQSKYLLASAYLLSGQSKAAHILADNLQPVPEECEEDVTGSDLRNQSLMLMYLLLNGDRQEAFKLAGRISEALSGGQWLSTQSTSMALVAMCEFALRNKTDEEFNFLYEDHNGVQTIQGRQQSVCFQPAFETDSLSGRREAVVKLNNTGNGTLFVTVTNQGIPQGIDASDASQGLSLQVNYYRSDGTLVDPAKLKQGTDFLAKVTVSNTGNVSRSQLALTQLFPSGWEIINDRLAEIATGQSAEAAGDYRDIRDDRVVHYFGLAPKTSKTFLVHLNAAYRGEFVLAPTVCEDMYDAGNCHARKGGRKVIVY